MLLVSGYKHNYKKLVVRRIEYNINLYQNTAEQME